MALSGKLGASASGLKIAACTASLNFDTFFNIASAEKLSDTLHPVKSVSAPRLAPPEIKRRRVGSAITLPASRTSNCLSTPGIRSERRRPMTDSPRGLLAADDHGAQALRHQQRQRDVNHQKRDDQSHADEMNIAGDIIAAEQR